MFDEKEGRMIQIAQLDSPLGMLTLASADGITLSGLWIDGQKYDRALLKGERVRECGIDELPIFRESARWLKLYFSGREPNFYPRLSFSGSEFRKAIAREMLAVPYGQTASYKELAVRLAAKEGKDFISPHATGGAVAHNPLLLFIPCHRIIAADGRLSGYAGGIEKKKYLLKLEQAEPNLQKCNTSKEKVRI